MYYFLIVKVCDLRRAEVWGNKELTFSLLSCIQLKGLCVDSYYFLMIESDAIVF